MTDPPLPLPTAQQMRQQYGEHRVYLPAGVDFDCCAECNRRTNGYIEWPCEPALLMAENERLAAALAAAVARAEQAEAEVQQHRTMLLALRSAEGFLSNQEVALQYMQRAEKAEAERDEKQRVIGELSAALQRPAGDRWSKRFEQVAVELEQARAEVARLRTESLTVAEQLREIAETWLYDGDTDQPVNDGYGQAYALLERLAAQRSAAPS